MSTGRPGISRRAAKRGLESLIGERGRLADLDDGDIGDLTKEGVEGGGTGVYGGGDVVPVGLHETDEAVDALLWVLAGNSGAEGFYCAHRW